MTQLIELSENRRVPPHLQLRAVLEAEAVLEQAGDVGQVHTQEGAAGRRLGHVVAHCGTEQTKGWLRGRRSTQLR